MGAVKKAILSQGKVEGGRFGNFEKGGKKTNAVGKVKHVVVAEMVMVVI